MLLALIGIFIALLLGIGEGLIKDLLQILRKIVIPVKIADVRVKSYQMVGLRQVFLNGMDVFHDYDAIVIFLSVNSTLLQSGEQFGAVYRSRSCAQAFKQLHMVFVFHGADLQPADIFNVLDLLICGKMAVSADNPQSLLNAGFLKFGVYKGHQILIRKKGFAVVKGAICKRSIKNAEAGTKADLYRGALACQGDCAGLNRLNVLPVCAKLCGRINLAIKTSGSMLVEIFNDGISDDIVG